MPAAGLRLFVLAHHDDEVFCAGHLRRALAGGGRVRLLWATAGGLAPARRRLAEGARVLEVLGLPTSAGVDLRLRDQHAVEDIAVIVRAVVRLLDDDRRDQAGPATEDDPRGLAGPPPDDDRRSKDHERDAVVYVPAYEGGHPDHDAVNRAAALAAAARPGLRVVELPLYRRGPFGLTVQQPSPAAWTSRARCAAVPLSDEDLVLRRALARTNSSQLLPSLLPLLALASWAGRGRAPPPPPPPPPPHDYGRPPHPGRLLYEFYTPWRFARWSAAAARGSTSLPR
jgi:LmbE family N-acetylglucosaminyl deacetylase